jgi:spore maturation protein CgeB
MKIVFFGSSLVSSYWNGAATYYRGLLKELARLGCDITFCEPDAFDRQKHRDMSDPAWAQIVVYPANEEGWRGAVETAAGDCDLLVKASGVGVFDAELAAAIPTAARSDTITVYWDVDAPATLEAMAQDPQHHLRRIIPLYDMVLTYGGHTPVIEGYRRFGANDCVPIYNALDPETHYPVPTKEAFRCDLSFLGNRLPDREARVEEFFLKAAALQPSRSFVLGGSGWETKVLPQNVRPHGHVGTSDHNAFYCSALATLNVNRDSMARYGYSPPTRIFEAAGARACIISDRWEGIELFLDPGREILVAGTGEEVAEQVASLNPEKAQLLGQAARSRILAEHTYAHRAKQVARLFDLLPARSEAAA